MRHEIGGAAACALLWLGCVVAGCNRDEATMRKPSVQPPDTTASGRTQLRIAPDGKVTRAGGNTARRFAPSELLLQLRPTQATREKAVSGDPLDFLRLYPAVRSAVALRTGRQGARIELYRVSVTVREDAELLDLARALGRDPRVQWVEPNHLLQTAAYPSDPLYPEQGHHGVIGSEGAWNRSIGDPSLVVAIIDTGIDRGHPDLVENLWAHPSEIEDGLDNDANGYVDDLGGWDFVSAEATEVGLGEDPGPPDNDAQDAMGHGTLVAGVVGARGDNGIGVTGTAWQVSLMPLRAGYRGPNGDGLLRASDVAEALFYAADNGAHVVNMSFRSEQPSHAIQLAVVYATQRGLSLVAAAGNDVTSAPRYPAAHDGVLAVGALRNPWNRAYFSNHGGWVDLTAPGQNVLSTALGGGYERVAGTSIAAPMVAGAIALLRSAHPTWSAEQVARQLLATARSIDGANGVFAGKLGAGRLAVDAALTDVVSAARLVVSDLFVEEEVGDGDGEYEPNETLRLLATVKNFGSDAPAGATVRLLGGADGAIEIVDGSAALPSLPFERAVTAAALRLRVAAGAPVNGNAVLAVSASANGADSELATLQLPLAPSFRRPQLLADEAVLGFGERGQHMRQLPDGRVVHLIDRAGATTQGIFATFRELDGRWSPPRQISDASSHAHQHDSFVDAQGDVHVVYSRNLGSWRAEVFYVRYSAASRSWGSEVQVSSGAVITGPSLSMSWNAEISVDRLGRRHVAWVDHRAGEPQLFVTYDRGSGFVRERPVRTLSPQPSTQSELSLVETSATTRVLFVNYGESALAVHGRNLSWDSGHEVTRFANQGPVFVPGGGTAVGTPHMLVRTEPLQGELLLARYRGAAWSIVEAVAPNPVPGWGELQYLLAGMLMPDGTYQLAISHPEWMTLGSSVTHRRGRFGAFSVETIPRSTLSRFAWPTLNRDLLGRAHLVGEQHIPEAAWEGEDGSSVAVFRGAGAEYSSDAPVDASLLPTKPSVSVVTTSPELSATRLEFRLSSSHPDGILYYEYAVGSAPGAHDLVRWTRAVGQAEPTVVLDLTDTPLLPEQTYFVSARAKSAVIYESTIGTSAPFGIGASLGALSVSRTAQPLSIDGEVESAWAAAVAHSVDKPVLGEPSALADSSAQFRLLWDASFLYVLVDVNDQSRVRDSVHPWEDDSVEIYLDGAGERSAQYDGNDYQYVFRFRDAQTHVGVRSARADPGVRSMLVATSSGYRLEAAIPWNGLGSPAGLGRLLGLDVHVNDDDDGSTREGKIAWSASVDNGWEDPRAFRAVALSADDGRQTYVAQLPSAPPLPLLDGQRDESFLRSAAHPVARLLRGAAPAAHDLTASWRAQHDSVYLYLFVEVTDDRVVVDSDAAIPWEDDAVELFVDGDESGGSAYDGSDDIQLLFRPNDPQARLGVRSAPVNTNEIAIASRQTASGYQMEIYIPWSVLKIGGGYGKTFAFDLQVDDDDDGGARDHKLAWWSASDESWQRPELFGRVRRGE
jgi:subtilisin family serine protease